MGDSRASVKIDFSIYGKSYKYDGWINWFTEEYDGNYIDQRILEFFDKSYRDARWDYDEASRIEAKRRAAQGLEDEERAELNRLKAKYEPDSMTPSAREGG